MIKNIVSGQNTNIFSEAQVGLDMHMMHLKYGVHESVDKLSVEHKNTFLRFRLDFLLEELKESYKAAGYELDAKIVQVKTPDQLTMADAEEVVDGLIDLTVVAVGTLDLLNVDFDDAWNQVYAANTTKEIGVKESRPNPLGLPDLIKPSGWVAPSHLGNHGDLLEMFGPQE